MKEDARAKTLDWKNKETKAVGGMRRGLEDGHRITAREVRGSKPATSTSFLLGTDEIQKVPRKDRNSEALILA